MSTALAERALAAPTVTPEEVALITRTVASGATNDELKLYLYDCARQGVHPLDKLIHFTKRKGKYTPITSIDFMRTRAADTGDYAGSDDAVFSVCAHCGGENIPGPDVETFAARVTVWRMVQGQRCAFTATARWSEYKPAENDFMWQKMPHTMLAKCAEALALRKGFPRQLAGLYAKEEMDQAGESHSGYTVTAPSHAPAVAEAISAGPRVAPNEAETSGQSYVAAPDDGRLYIQRVDRKPTRNQNVVKFVVVLSDGREVSTIKTPLGDLAEQLCQEGDAVLVETSSSRWGENLDGLRRDHSADDSHQDDDQFAAPLSDDDIPF